MASRARLTVAVLLVALSLPLQGALADLVPVDTGRPGGLLPHPAGLRLLARPIDVLPGEFAAYGTGTVVHADALTPPGGTTGLIGLDVAFSGAAFSSAVPSGRLIEAGCKLGEVTEGPSGPGEPGTVTDQTPNAGTTAAVGTEVNITVNGPLCTVPTLVGLAEDKARELVEAEGCKLDVTTEPVTNLADAGKVRGQSPDAGSKLPPGSTVNVTIGTSAEVLGIRADRVRAEVATETAGGNLARTGGIALGGVALWLVVSGLSLRLAGRSPRGRGRR